MAHMIQKDNLSAAWLQAVEYLHTLADQKAVNLSIAINQPGVEDARIRAVINDALSKRQVHSVHTVANTIFPQALYMPGKLGVGAREHLYENSRQGFTVAKRHCGNRWGRYIQRLIAWPGHDREVNQLEETVVRLQRELALPNTCSSIYEIGIADPEEYIEHGADLRINRPDYDTWRRGSPCLSHISLTLEDKRLHMTALYRNQDFFYKAYGNYVGLSNLLAFFCREVGCDIGELLCVATHADASLCKRDIETIIASCYMANVID